MNAWGRLGEFRPQILSGELTMCLVKKDFVKQNMALKA